MSKSGELLNILTYIAQVQFKTNMTQNNNANTVGFDYIMSLNTRDMIQHTGTVEISI